MKFGQGYFEKQNIAQGTGRIMARIMLMRQTNKMLN